MDRIKIDEIMKYKEMKLCMGASSTQFEKIYNNAISDYNDSILQLIENVFNSRTYNDEEIDRDTQAIQTGLQNIITLSKIDVTRHYVEFAKKRNPKEDEK